MRAVVYARYGPPEVLQLRELDQPVPKDNEVRIRVRAAEATKADCELRAFRFPVKWFWLPLRFVFGLTKPKRQVLGGYFAGQIDEVGRATTQFAAGDRVFGGARLRLGAYGEYVCLPEDYTIVPMPESMSFEQAAAVPLGGLNAIHFMRLADVQDGAAVLVNGAGGSIGTFAVQIAKAMGAEVTAVDSAIKEDMLKAIGADHFIDYRQVNFTRTGQTYDVILDMVARSSYRRCIRALRPKGRYLMANPRVSDMARSLLTRWFTNKRAVFAFANETREELLALREMIDAGQVRSAIDRVMPLDQAAEAHRRVEAEERLGIVVLSHDWESAEATAD